MMMGLCDQKVIVHREDHRKDGWYSVNPKTYHYYYPWYFVVSDKVTFKIYVDWKHKRLRLDYDLKLTKEELSKLNEYIRKRHGFMYLDNIDLKYSYKNCQRIVNVLQDLVCYEYPVEHTVGAK